MVDRGASNFDFEVVVIFAEKVSFDLFPLLGADFHNSGSSPMEFFL
jgi:hypothetical protein